jgi:RNA-directed DNA polymerase
MHGTPTPQSLSTILQWIAKGAREHESAFRTLAHHMTPELLHDSYRRIRKDAAVGVDGQTAKEYSKDLEANLRALHTRLREQRYRAPAIRRVWIPKEDGSGKQRPLGLPTFEDKIVQRAVVTLLEGIYENDFYEFSYGYRKGKSCHQALEALWQQTMSGMQWIIDGDISDYFTTIDHGRLREFLGRRVADRSIIRLIGKWLNAGVLEDETLSYLDQGTPQGGVISPLLANMYLHYVLDEWFVTEVKPRLRGRAYLIRVADDFVIGCDYEEDARRLMAVLPKRMQKYNLTIHPEKTRLLDFRKPGPQASKGKDTFDFVGFRHYWGKTRRGKWVVKRKTAAKRQRRTMRRLRDWCRANRHEPVRAQHRALSAKLRGYYNYYGVTGNFPSLRVVYRWAERQWWYWLNRRGGTRRSWSVFSQTIGQAFCLPLPFIVHRFGAAGA